MSGRAPIERAQSPQISQCSNQDSNEYERLNIPRPAQLTESDSPGKKKCSFHIENYKEHRDQIKFGRQPEARKTSGNDAAFERFVGLAGRVALADYIRKRHNSRDKHHDEEEIDDQWPDFSQLVRRAMHLRVSFGLGPLVIQPCRIRRKEANASISERLGVFCSIGNNRKVSTIPCTANAADLMGIARRGGRTPKTGVGGKWRAFSTCSFLLILAMTALALTRSGEADAAEDPFRTNCEKT